jgi:hypothetical protein
LPISLLQIEPNVGVKSRVPVGARRWRLGMPLLQLCL